MDEPPVDPFAVTVLNQKITDRRRLIDADAFFVVEFENAPFKIFCNKRLLKMINQHKFGRETLLLRELKRVVEFNEASHLRGAGFEPA